MILVNLIHKYRISLLKGVLVLSVLTLSWYSLQFSSIYQGMDEMTDINLKFALLNIATNGALLSVIFILCNSLWLSCAIFAGSVFLISVVNHYTIQLHDSPLTVAELGNWRTAANVLSGYQLELNRVVGLASILAVECLLIYLIWRLTKKSEKNLKRRLVVDGVLALVSVAVIFFGYLWPYAVMSESVEWQWVSSYQKCGYMACTIKSAYETANAGKKPDGYDKQLIANMEIEEKTLPAEEPPDVILILNESFYDMATLIDLETDVPYMENIQSLDNAICGYAIQPAGGTNVSEYELLTSNSTKLLRGIIPFNVLNMEGNSIVSHMDRLGYTTTGAHCASPGNYNRGRAYPELGFDHIYFEDSFVDKEYFGNRHRATDASLYKNLLSWYQQSDETPQFLYLLTIQNHGGWKSNSREMNTVHALNNFGEYDDQVDEYLSCIRLSDQAFKELTDQLKEVDRKVIVCMVGDHGPSLLNKIVDDPPFMLRVRVPFVIWANYDLEDTQGLDGNTISLPCLVPSLLATAGVTLSPYYQYMVDMSKQIPIITPWVLYFDKNGESYSYDQPGEYTDLVNNYLYLEYNNLQKDREQRLFDPYQH